eukprot:jgi/Chlat1/8629/Chrsp86S08028
MASSSAASRVTIAIPGGGMLFYWQLGAASALARRYDSLSLSSSTSSSSSLPTLSWAGASAGALAAALAAARVDPHHAAEEAIALARRERLWQRGGGGGGGGGVGGAGKLALVWGKLVREWLHGLLDEKAGERCRGRVKIALGWPWLWRIRRRHVSDFASTPDLIECLMASVHIPVFLDGRLFHTLSRPTTQEQHHHQQPPPSSTLRCIDGSMFLSHRSALFTSNASPPSTTHPDTPTYIFLDYKDDPDASLEAGKFLTLGRDEDATREWIDRMMGMGERHVAGMWERGEMRELGVGPHPPTTQVGGGEVREDERSLVL